MKILITGSKGFVGKHLTISLEKKYKIVSYDLIDGQDIFDEKLLNKSLNNVDVVIHLAAFVSGIESWDKPEEYLLNNGIGTYKVIKSAIKKRVKKIIIFSSAAVYGDPLTPYGASKIFAETIAKSYKDQIEIVIVRPFNIYGKGQNPAYGYVIHNFANGIKNNKQIEIFGTGVQTRDFILINDIVNTIEKLIKIKSPNKAIDLGTGNSIKIINLANLVGNVLNMKYNVIYSKARNELLESEANIKDLQNIGIDVSKFTKLEDGLKEILLK
jgi:UDP-glucose 4-epimerase